MEWLDPIEKEWRWSVVMLKSLPRWQMWQQVEGRARRTQKMIELLSVDPLKVVRLMQGETYRKVHFYASVKLIDFGPGDGMKNRRASLLISLVVLLSILGSSLALAATVGNRHRGLVFAKANCSSCHAIRAKQLLSPLAAATPFQTIAEIDGMTATALHVFFQTPHKTMPNLIVTGEDKDDVISYILGLRLQR